MTLVQTSSVDDICQFVVTHSQVLVRGGGSKSALSRDATLDLGGLAGVVEYDPSEYTFTALAGTPLAMIRDLLAQEGQYLPFDPILVTRGATLGGTVATGLSGPGRFRYGGVRDFLLGVRVVNGEGQVVRGGGKVVKNAAGFDIPKLLVGSLGRFGVMVELTFKVFPAAESSTTLRIDYPDLDLAVAGLQRLALSPAEVACLDLDPPRTLWVRIAGQRGASAAHVQRAEQIAGGAAQRVEGDDELRIWDETREFSWLPDGHCLVRMPLLPGQIARSEQLWLETDAGPRRYSVGGNLLWLAWPEAADWSSLDGVLAELARSGLVVTGSCPDPQRGAARTGAFAERLASVFDPHRKFRSAW